jgi:hypothetical protein
MVCRVSPERLDVRLEHWGGEGLQLLERLNTPDMTRHVGGPESAEKLISIALRSPGPRSIARRATSDPTRAST